MGSPFLAANKYVNQSFIWPLLMKWPIFIGALKIREALWSANKQSDGESGHKKYTPKYIIVKNLS
jgi:hypothetical protein